MRTGRRLGGNAANAAIHQRSLGSEMMIRYLDTLERFPLAPSLAARGDPFHGLDWGNRDDVRLGWISSVDQSQLRLCFCGGTPHVGVTVSKLLQACHSTTKRKICFTNIACTMDQ